MSDVIFELKQVDAKPRRQFRKGSKYDPILDTFMAGLDALVAVEMADKEASYLRIILNKRIDARALEGIKVSVINNVCYLEKG